jgi:hypothetical protein
MKQTIYLFIVFITFCIGQVFAMSAAFVTLPYKNITMWEAYKIAIPYAWVDWIFMNYGLNLSDKYKLFSNDQIVFLIILIQFVVVMLISKFYLKTEIYYSDFIGLMILIFGFVVSEYNLFSTYFKLEIPSHEIKKQSVGPISQLLNPKNSEFETNIIDKPNETNDETNELDDKHIQDDHNIDVNLNEV